MFYAIFFSVCKMRHDLFASLFIIYAKMCLSEPIKDMKDIYSEKESKNISAQTAIGITEEGIGNATTNGFFSVREIKSFLKVLRFLEYKFEIERKELKQSHKGGCEASLSHICQKTSKEQIFILEERDKDVTLKDLLYTDESPWSYCRRSCSTFKYRKCRIDGICLSPLFRDEASCYIPGTKCEKKMTAKLLAQARPTGIGTAEPNPYSNKRKQKSEEDSSSDESREKFDSNEDFHFVNDDYDQFLGSLPPVIADSKRIDGSITEAGGDASQHSVDKNSKNSDSASFAIDYDEYIPADNYFDYNYDERIDSADAKSLDETSIRQNDSKQLSIDDIGSLSSSSSGFDSKQCGRSKFSLTSSTFLRIIGGTEVIKNSWPWQVAVLNRFKEVFCGGTLIADRWVLTAAHCRRKKLYVRLHEHDIRIPDGEKEFKVEKIIRHPAFDYETIDSDIALLKLPLKAANQRKKLHFACLPAKGSPLPFKQTCIALGWGKRRKTHIFGSDVLRYVKVPIVGREVCQKAYDSHSITKNMFCAGSLRGGADACDGDSGGPLLCENESGQWVIQGVISFGDGCGDEKRFGVYVRVANYVEWIEENIINV